MKKRILAILLIFLFAITPALAAGTTTRIITKDGPVWVGVQGAGSDSALVYSANKGKTWKATEGYGSGGGYIWEIQYTGRDYFLTGIWCKFAYFSTDGKTWSTMPEQEWFQDNSSYVTDGRCSGKYQILWTGTEYMMCRTSGGTRAASVSLTADPTPETRWSPFWTRATTSSAPWSLTAR